MFRRNPKIKKVTVYFDGAARGNPGPAGIGILIYTGAKKPEKEIFRYIGEATNNVAEYTALVHALLEAKLLNAGSVIINTDSELVARQLSGEYRVKSEGLKPLFEQALSLLKEFDTVKIHRIDRKENRGADKLANKAINLSGR